MDHYNASSKQIDLVPELTGTENTLRERYEVSVSDQPYLYIPTAVTPETYYIRSAKFNLLNLNDMILANDTFSPIIDSIILNPVASGKFSTKAVELSALPNPILATSQNFLFDGLAYNKNILENYVDNLYTGKVNDWDSNGLKVGSCEEYAYEKFYDFSLFKDFDSLHGNDPFRVVEYAYRNASLDENNINIVQSDLKPGAIGSKFMYTFSSLSASALDTISRNGVLDSSTEPISVFQEMKLNYMPYGYSNTVNSGNKSYFYESDSPDISVDVYWNHVFAKNQIRLVCADPTNPNCVITPNYDFMPKNFFVEVMGHINKTNQTRTAGIVLSNPDLISVFDDTGFGPAQECYNNNFQFHFLMLQGAKRLYPNSTTLKNKLLEFKLLRKHLIQLLSERTKYENSINPTLTLTPSEYILSSSETLPPSEKDYAMMRVNEYKSSHAPATKKNKASIINAVDVHGIQTVDSILKKIDDQIEAVLLEAKAKGCLDVALWGNTHNYPINSTTNKYDLDYDKALCDWSPEMFTTAAVTLIPDKVYENVYSDCNRTVADDFHTAQVDNYKFQFPSMCQDTPLFQAWSPNKYVDYTKSTIKFHEFETLVKQYPEALMDCDSVIQKKTKKDLTDAGMNYFDPITHKIMVSKSRSYYDNVGGEYAGLEFGYALGWLYEGYDTIPNIKTQNIGDRGFVCQNTGFFAFGNYFAGGSFLKQNFTICSAGSYASNKTSGNGRPTPPTLSSQKNTDRINNDINAVAASSGVNSTYFVFIKDEKITYQNNNASTASLTYSHPYSGDTVSYNNSPKLDAQMLSFSATESVPICGIISITISGAVTGYITADTFVNADKQLNYQSNACKALNYNFTPHMDFDGFASASVTAGISGVASISAGVDVGLKFIGISFPYTANLALSQGNGTADDIPFNYDINIKAYSNLDQEITLLSGYLGAFVKIEYIIDSNTYRQTLFSWDGIRFTGNIDRVGSQEVPFSVPVRALYGLSQNLSF
jgi:hypothetical protein